MLVINILTVFVAYNYPYGALFLKARKANRAAALQLMNQKQPSHFFVDVHDLNCYDNFTLSMDYH